MWMIVLPQLRFFVMSNIQAAEEEAAWTWNAGQPVPSGGSPGVASKPCSRYAR
jgi:hypothetical protein